MNILITAGNTLAMIDRVRCITNIFSGRTGARIAFEAWTRGHRVRLLTSHPEAVLSIAADQAPADANWSVHTYRTFDELREAMRTNLATENWDAAVHAAAVSDYLAGGIYAIAEGGWTPQPGKLVGDGPITMLDRAAAKVKSDEPELWLRLVRAPKLVDLIRSEWGFRGVLVKFKLEVGIDENELLAVAERSRQQSSADLMVANSLEGMRHFALLGAGMYERVARAQLAGRLIQSVEELVRKRLQE